MKKMMVAVCALCLAAGNALAGGPGTTSANFLKAAQGVRPISMGETYIALGDGIDTLYWNPAGLVQLGSPEIGFIHNFWLQDIGTEYLAYGSPLGPLGAFGGGVTVLHGGSIDQTLEDAAGNYAGIDGQTSALSVAVIGAYAQKLNRLIVVPADSFLKDVLVGASLRVVSETIADSSVFGGGVDVGAIWRQTEEIAPQDVASATGGEVSGQEKIAVRDQGLRLGFVAQNLGATTDSLMPMNFRAGAGYIVNDLFSPYGRGTVAADLLIPIDNTLRVSIGAEYAHITENTQFAARTGYKAGSEIKDLDSLSGLTAGVGVSINAGLIRYQLDYAFVPYGELGSTHRVALTLGFLPTENAVRPSASAEVVAPLPGAPVAAPVATGSPKPSTSSTSSTSSTPTTTPLETTTTTTTPPQKETTPDRVAELGLALERLQGRIRSGLLPGINFKRGETQPLDESKRVMDQAGRLVEGCTEAKVTIVGYDADKKVAEEKAKAVARYITMSFRVSPDRISAKAGEVAKQPKGTAIGFEVAETK